MIRGLVYLRSLTILAFLSLATDCGEDLSEAALGCERTALTCQ